MRITLFFLCFAPYFLFGQMLVNNSETPVSFRIVGVEVSVVYTGCGLGGTYTYTYEGASMSIDGHTITTDDVISEDNSLSHPFSATEIINLKQSKQYTLTATNGARVLIECEPGYSSFVDGVPSDLIVATTPGSYSVSIVKTKATTAALPQFSEKVNFEFGLGGLLNGVGGGAIVLISDTVSSDTFDPVSLRYSSVETDEIEVINVSSELRQILLPDTLVDIVDAGVSDGYEIRYYAGGDYGTSKSGGVYPINSGAQPYSKYQIKDPTPADATDDLKVTKYYEGAVVSVTEVFHDQSSNTWEYLSGDGSTVMTKRKVVVDTVNEKETEEIRDGSNTLAYKAEISYQNYAWGDEIASFVLDPDDKAFTQSFDYFDNASNEGDYRKLKSIEYTTGYWVSYDYYDTNRDEGLLKTMYEPYLNSPSSPSINPNSGRVTQYTYGSDVDAARALPTEIETTINGVMVFKVINEFELEPGLLNSKPVLKTTTKNYFGSGSNDYLATESYAYSRILNATDWQFLDKALCVC